MSADDLDARILDAIRPLLAEDSDGDGDGQAAYRGLPVAFMGAIEVIGDDGEPYIVMLRSPSSLPAWRILGMAEYVSEDARARMRAVDE